MSWFIKKRQQKTAVEEKTVRVPEGLWVKCEACKELIYRAELVNTRNVCPKCGYHFRIGVEERLKDLMDPGFEERFGELYSTDPLGFVAAKPYAAQLKKLREAGQDQDAIVMVEGTLKGHPVVLGVMNFDYLAASMGSVVGEKITRAIERGLEKKQPVIVISASGGARMQEGIYSLMQMAKTSHAIALLEQSGMPFFVVLTDPTTGGVTASFAMLGDVILAEPNAYIGFAGARVIEGTIKHKLPEGFQRSEFQRDKGFCDMVVNRKDMKKVLSFLIDAHTNVEGGRK